MACAYTALGQRDAALTCLAAVLDNGFDDYQVGGRLPGGEPKPCKVGGPTLTLTRLALRGWHWHVSRTTTMASALTTVASTVKPSTTS
jgi:hypothetical protein